ncbi:PRTRC system protein C [Sphingobacterium lactis]|uniref:PRTRC system protein C n=1 Tax=Sphingobacterium TaxID=28453 RepID=UPI0021A5ACB5|nr:PRTRC system protein C [Sphingobacterium hotanense]MCT1526057.1 PRTRC system protein C [Sphingobacterium hotanense]
MLVSEFTRVFKFTENGNEVKLEDPAPELSPEGVLNFYSGAYPILTTAKVEGPVFNNDEEQYTFKTVMGTKG